MLSPIRGNLLFCLLFGIILNNLHAQVLPISTIQGTAAASAFEGQLVTTPDNIVTAKGNGFFFVQSPPAAADDDPLTSEGLLVLEAYFGNIGDVVTLTGTVVEEDAMTALADVSVSPSGSTLPLPPAVVLDSDLPSPTPALMHSLERLEGMRVQFSATANGPSSSFETAPLRIGGERVFREAGIRYPGLPGLPVWDGNPELFWFDPNGLNAPNNRFIVTDARIEANAILYEAGSRFWIALATDYTLENNGADAPSVRPRQAGEYTVGSLNLLQYFEEAPDFELKTDKLVRYIGDQMRWPDVLAVQEAGSLGALNALADALQDRYPTVVYDAYLLPSNGSIKSGFLVRDYLQDIQVTQLGASEVFSFSGGLLHDRPPLLLKATLPAEDPVRVQVLNLHLRSLIGIEGEAGFAEFVRNKRHQQGISVAQMVAELRPGGNLIVLGDFNAFHFTDGYVDVFNQIGGQSSLGALLPPLSITVPPLANQLQNLPPQERYSYVFQGSAQALDHCLTAGFEELTVNALQYARGNADFPEAYASNPNLPLRASDHDGLVLFVEPDGTVPAAEATASSALNLIGPNPIRQGQSLQLKSGARPLRQLQLYSANGQLLEQRGLQGAQHTFTWPRLPAGVYIMVLQNGRETVRYRVLSLD